ncbi:hypothetical protein [Rhodococcus sp. SGAir0479]|uniref:hypothetical protein n=1 Tax=Rhodococcus sp. SGAir0479 TaxID=2567884 RepID=UPI0010CCDEDF|nr:hypothetical protein [Rhodococcus sp. SGAir0479]QCQ92251.1 hypothetical protein E7742_14145 [Rhodococcus sp. SGAir0479]
MATEPGVTNNPDDPSRWHYYAVVGTTVGGGHTLAEFGPHDCALAALQVAVHSVNHTAYSIFEQGIAGHMLADPAIVERLPVTNFTVERQHPVTRAPDADWTLTGGRRTRRVSADLTA